MEVNKIYCGDCQELIKLIPDNSIDCICTDPPYLYLKNQKLEREFDEKELFKEYKRVLKPKGFIILFGRGASFYRWNTLLIEMGFNFKEEIIWNKAYTTSPMMAINRVHETISILTKKNGIINRVKVPYLEQKQHDIDSIVRDINRLKSVLKNDESLNNVLEFFKGNKYLSKKRIDKYTVSAQSGISPIDRSAAVLNAMKNGMNEKTIINSHRFISPPSREGMYDFDRSVKVLNSIDNGMNEKTIIFQVNNHYNTTHPTQKPVRLLERLLALVRPKDIERPIVLDTFAGSCGIAKAALNTGWSYICMEIDQEYYEAGKNDIEKYIAAGIQKTLF